MVFDKTRWCFPSNSDQNCSQKSAKVWWGVGGGGSDIRTEVKSLKIDIAERTRNCASLLLKIAYCTGPHRVLEIDWTRRIITASHKIAI